MTNNLGWYEHAKLDDVREAYGKTWHVVKIEDDSTIHWGTTYCGRSEAVTPKMTPKTQVQPAAMLPRKGKVSDFIRPVPGNPMVLTKAQIRQAMEEYPEHMQLLAKHLKIVYGLLQAVAIDHTDLMKVGLYIDCKTGRII